MSSDAVSLILDADGTVVGAAVGTPADVPVETGQTVILLDAAASTTGVWVGWVRQADGSWQPPGGPVRPPTQDELVAYAHEAHLAAETGGTTWKGWPVRVDERALTRMLGERLAVQDGVRGDTDPWTFGDGVARPVSNADLALLSQRMRRHIGVCLAVFNQVAAGIAAAQVTTRAQVDAAFAGVDSLVLAGAAS